MSTIKVVIIDDDQNVSKLFEELIELHNVKVVGIGFNGLHAITLTEEKNPDIVFLDTVMPKMNGIDALKEIKKKCPATKVIMVTGDKSEDLKKLLEDYGANAIIYKPFDMAKIMQVFEQVKIQPAVSNKF